MKNTKFALVLAILLLMASIGLWGQTPTGTGTPLGIANQSADSTGGHMSRGCYLCHTPHTLGVTVQPSAKGITTWQGACTTSPCPIGTTAVPGAQGSATGLPVAGNVYLWGQALPPLTYNSWDTTGPTTFNSAAVTGGTAVLAHPEVHSLMCLSCHDGATTGSSYDMGYLASKMGPGGTNAGTGGSSSTNPYGGTGSAFGTPGLVGLAWSQWTNSGTNNGWATQSSLMNSHPIHAHYTVGGVTVAGLWQVTINNTAFTVKFNDNTGFSYWTPFSATGHPARLWTDGTDAYVECTTCHEPHRFSQYAYPSNGSWNTVADGGTWEIGPPNSTVYYLRGPYSDVNSSTDGTLKGNTTPNGEMNAQFCRSCHYEKSTDYFANNGAPK
jgi:hypothetical protein